MSEVRLLKADQMAAIDAVVQCYLADLKDHMEEFIVSAAREFGALTITGNLLFGASAKQPATLVRTALKKLQEAGDVKVTDDCYCLTKAPSWRHGRSDSLRKAETAIKSAVVTRLESGDVQPASDLYDAAQDAVASILQAKIDAGDLPVHLPFALFRRVMDGLVECKFCDCVHQPQDGEIIEVFKKHEEKPKGADKKQKKLSEKKRGNKPQPTATNVSGSASPESSTPEATTPVEVPNSPISAELLHALGVPLAPETDKSPPAASSEDGHALDSALVDAV